MCCGPQQTKDCPLPNYYIFHKKVKCGIGQMELSTSRFYHGFNIVLLYLSFSRNSLSRTKIVCYKNIRGTHLTPPPTWPSKLNSPLETRPPLNIKLWCFSLLFKQRGLLHACSPQPWSYSISQPFPGAITQGSPFSVSPTPSSPTFLWSPLSQKPRGKCIKNPDDRW